VFAGTRQGAAGFAVMLLSRRAAAARPAVHRTVEELDLHLKVNASRDEALPLLRRLAAITAAGTDEDFFRQLVRHLAATVLASDAFITEFIPPARTRTLAFWSDGEFLESIDYECPRAVGDDALRAGVAHVLESATRSRAAAVKIAPALNVSLGDADGSCLGHLYVSNNDVQGAGPNSPLILQLFAALAAARLHRLRLERSLRQSEERFRDLFDEAPIAYVHEDLQARFIRANRSAQRILGIAPEEVPGMVGFSLVPDTPDARRRVEQVFQSVKRGEQVRGVLIELKRKDDGRPIFAEFWSSPDPGGQYTRTMLVDVTERVLLEREQTRLRAQNTYLQEEIQSVHDFEEIVGTSDALMKVLDSVRRVGPTDSTVLISGETGTGKELIARAIHSASKRADGPFIRVNCAALPAGLVESELFGHERGAFSGAIQRRIGRFELANSGTIFLDEVGDIPLDTQVKLLRVLQEHEIERVGGNQAIKVDARVLAATNRDLHIAMTDGKFRPDLYYRLNVFPLLVPPLRQRTADIPLLAHFFLRKYASRVGRGAVVGIDPGTMDRLLHYHWPGNVRELQNIIERGLILGSTPNLVLDSEVFLTPTPARSPQLTPQSEAAADLNAMQRGHILKALNTTNWVIEGKRGAAARLGMKPATLRHRMKKLGILRHDPSPA
jgi:formate hydrogenlyase transcriptional activator